MVWVSPFKIRASTGISVNPKYWLKDKPFVSTKHPRYEYIRTKLIDLDGRIFNEAIQYENRPKEFTLSVLQTIINPARKVKDNGNIKDWFNQWRWEFLASKNKLNHLDVNAENNQVYQDWKKQVLHKERYNLRGKEELKSQIKGLNTYVAMRTTVGWITKFSEQTKAQDIDKEWLPEFYQFIYAESEIRSSNSIRLLQSNLKKILKEHQLPSEWIEVVSAAETETFDLYWPEVLKLKDTMYADPLVAEAAHTFVINCQLCLRWSDLTSLTPASYLEINTRKHGAFKAIIKKQVKTEYTTYIPIPPMAQALIDRYGRIPIPRNQDGSFNNWYYWKRLKEATQEAKLERKVLYKGKLVPLHQVISGHNSRQTGASRIFEVTRNDALKEKLLGHKFKNDPYTKVAPGIIADELLSAWNLIEAEGNKQDYFFIGNS